MPERPPPEISDENLDSDDCDDLDADSTINDDSVTLLFHGKNDVEVATEVSVSTRTSRSMAISSSRNLVRWCCDRLVAWRKVVVFLVVIASVVCVSIVLSGKESKTGKSSTLLRERILYEESFTHMWTPNLQTVSVNFGRYDDCARRNDGKIVLFLLEGHLRTFAKKLPNFHSFINAANPCKFVLIYTRNHMESGGVAWWGDRKKEAGTHFYEHPVQILENYVSEHTNTAYHVVQESPERLYDTDVCPTALALAVAKGHGININNNTIVVQTRNDLLFSHTIDFEALRNGGMSKIQTRNWIFMARHNVAATGGLDPQEALLVGNLGWFSSKYSYEALKKRYGPSECGGCLSMTHGPCSPVKNKARQECFSREKKAGGMIGHLWRRRQIFDSVCNDATPLFMNRDMKIHYFRLNGDYATAVQRPGNTALVNPKQPITHGPLDLRKGAAEIFAFANYASCFCGDRSRNRSAHKAEIDAYNSRNASFPESHEVSDGITLKERSF